MDIMKIIMVTFRFCSQICQKYPLNNNMATFIEQLDLFTLQLQITLLNYLKIDYYFFTV